MHIHVLVPIEEVTFTGLEAPELALDDDCTITTDINGVLAFVDAPLWIPQGSLHHIIGAFGRKSIADGGAVTFVLQESEEDLPDAIAEAFLRRVMALTDQFLFSLWLVKDNSVNSGSGVIALGSPDGLTSAFIVRPGGLHFTADCERRRTTFGRAEVDAATTYFRAYTSVAPQIEWRTDAPRPTGLIHDSRIARAMYLAQAARHQADIGVKLAFYCIAFESLFASESDSISHRVAERTASLIGTSGTECRTIYRDIRKLYSARSKVVHGTSLNAGAIDRLREVSRACDQHLRLTIRRILEDAELQSLFARKQNEVLDDHFLSRLFPDSDATHSEPGTPA